MVTSIAPEDTIAGLQEAQPEYMEDAREHLLRVIDQATLIEHLNRQLAGCSVQVYHGTRVTVEEAEAIRADGLHPLRLIDRGDALAAIFSQHPEWREKKGLL